jgi:hypothetical protein
LSIQLDCPVEIPSRIAKRSSQSVMIARKRKEKGSQCKCFGDKATRPYGKLESLRYGPLIIIDVEVQTWCSTRGTAFN